MKEAMLMIMIVLVLFVFSTHCGQGQNPDVYEETLDEVTGPVNVTFSLENRIPLPNLNYANLFVADNIIYTYGHSMTEKKKLVEVYEKNLNFLWTKSLNFGQGPGEDGGGTQFFVYGDSIYAPDNTLKRVSIFDRDLNFIKFVKMGSSYYPATFIKNGEWFICAEGMPSRDRKRCLRFNLVAFPSMKRKVIFELEPFSEFDSNKRLIVSEAPGIHYFYRNERLYFINMKTYVITVYDLGGNAVKRIKVNTPGKKVPPEMREQWLKEILGEYYRKSKFIITEHIQPASFMIPLKKGFVVIRRDSYSLSCSGHVEGDFFDYDLKLVGKLKFPCIYGLFRASTGYPSRTFQYDNGRLYLINTDGDEFFLEKWKVEE